MRSSVTNPNNNDYCQYAQPFISENIIAGYSAIPTYGFGYPEQKYQYSSEESRTNVNSN